MLSYALPRRTDKWLASWGRTTIIMWSTTLTALWLTLVGAASKRVSNSTAVVHQAVVPSAQQTDQRGPCHRCKWVPTAGLRVRQRALSWNRQLLHPSSVVCLPCTPSSELQSSSGNMPHCSVIGPITGSCHPLSHRAMIFENSRIPDRSQITVLI